MPTYKNTTFREGIVNTFGVGPKKVNGRYPLYVSWEDGSSGLSNVYATASTNGGITWAPPVQVNDNAGATEALQPSLDVAPNGTVVDAFYDRRLPCPAQGTPDAAGAGIADDPGTTASPGTPYGRANYCVNTAAQFYKPNLTPIGNNVRLSTHTWDPQLSALRPSCICSSTTFIGDYFGVASSGGLTYTTAVSTFNEAGENPFFHQQQVVHTSRRPEARHAWCYATFPNLRPPGWARARPPASALDSPRTATLAGHRAPGASFASAGPRDARRLFRAGGVTWLTRGGGFCHRASVTA